MIDPALELGEEEAIGRPPGLLESVKSMVATLLQVLHTRLELVTTELQEEMHRVASILLWGAVAVFFGGLFVLMVAATIIIAAGEEHRLLAALLMTVIFLVVCVLGVVMVKARLRRRQRLLSSSLEELRRDRERLKPSAPPRSVP